MSERIDVEIKRLLDLGQTPIRINVGVDLWKEMKAHNADMTKYQGFTVQCVKSVESSYLNIQTMTMAAAVR